MQDQLRVQIFRRDETSVQAAGGGYLMRLQALEETDMLAVTGEAADLAQSLIEAGAVPARAAEDALHIAIAVTNGVEYLLTWNCRHLANARMRFGIEQICRSKGYEPAVICTPEELLEEGP